MRNDYIAGDPLPADDVNSMVDAITTNAHNIFELYLENYFATKYTPYQGLFFDGFSDTAKIDSSSNAITIAVPSGQADIYFSTIPSWAKVGQEVDIFDVTTGKIETKIIQSITVGTSPFRWIEDFNTLVDGALNGQNGWTETQNELRVMATGTPYEGAKHLAFVNTGTHAEATKTFSVMTYGRVAFALKPMLQTDATPYVWLTGQASGTMDIDIACATNGYIQAYDRIGGWTNLVPYTFGNYYFIEVAFEYTAGGFEGLGQRKFKVRVNGGSWSAQLNGENATETGVVNLTLKSFAGSSQHYYDYIVIGDTTKITMTTNFANNYGTSAYLGRSSVDVDTVNKQIKIKTGLTRGVYRSKLQAFQQEIGLVYDWAKRTYEKYNLLSAIAVTDTTLTITGDMTARFFDTNKIDIYTADNTVRERKTISGSPVYASGYTTITFTPAIIRSAGFAITDFVERVNVIPQVSLVASGGVESFVDLDYQKTVVDFINLLAEDEFNKAFSPREFDFISKLILDGGYGFVIDYEQKFNDLTVGDLNGQDGWSGGTEVDVTTNASAIYEGTKGVQVYQPSGAQTITRSIINRDCGFLFIKIKKTLNTDGTMPVLELLNNNNNQTEVIIQFNSDGTIRYYDRLTASYLQIDSFTYASDTWIKLAIKFRCSGAPAFEGLNERCFKVSIDNGLTWSSELVFERTNGTGISHLTLILYAGSGKYNYFDWIAYEHNDWGNAKAKELGNSLIT